MKLTNTMFDFSRLSPNVISKRHSVFLSCLKVKRFGSLAYVMSTSVYRLYVLKKLKPRGLCNVW